MTERTRNERCAWGTTRADRERREQARARAREWLREQHSEYVSYATADPLQKQQQQQW